jgi:hypothetical protein
MAENQPERRTGSCSASGEPRECASRRIVWEEVARMGDQDGVGGVEIGLMVSMRSQMPIAWEYAG